VGNIYTKFLKATTSVDGAQYFICFITSSRLWINTNEPVKGD